MAPFLPVRAISRSQAVRVAKQTLKTGTTSYVDLGSQTETGGIKAGSKLPFSPFKELQNHLAQGAIIVVGALTWTNSDYAVKSGLLGAATKEAKPEVSVTAGEIVRRSTGVDIASAGFAAAKKEVAASGKERIDIVSVSETTGVTTYTAGTAALVGAAVAPATPGGGLLTTEFVFNSTETVVIRNVNRA